MNFSKRRIKLLEANEEIGLTILRHPDVQAGVVEKSLDEVKGSSFIAVWCSGGENDLHVWVAEASVACDKLLKKKSAKEKEAEGKYGVDLVCTPLYAEPSGVFKSASGVGAAWVYQIDSDSLPLISVAEMLHSLSLAKRQQKQHLFILILKNVLWEMKFVHSVGVAHLRLSPFSVRVRPHVSGEMSASLVDFSCARAVMELDGVKSFVHPSAYGSIKSGYPSDREFMAPELFELAKAASVPRDRKMLRNLVLADVYSFGKIVEVINQHLLPPVLTAMITKCVDPAVDNRPSAAELFDEFAACLDIGLAKEGAFMFVR